MGKLLEPHAAYARWAETYPPYAHNALMRVEQEAMENMMASLSPTAALDLGTGSGRYLTVLENAGARTTIGVDRSLAMLARARAGAAPLVCADAGALPFPAAVFDLVVASLMVGDVEDLPSWAREICRVLKPGGRLLYSDFHPTWAEQNWQRTFQDVRGRTWSVRYYPHTLADHRAALSAAGLDVLENREPLLMDMPVAFVIHAAKPAPG